jgi:hypothetical protein
MKIAIPLLALVFSLPAFAHEHGAHVHGVAKLDVAVEAGAIDLHLDAPLDSLLGFEHAPRDAHEREAVMWLRQSLAMAGSLFVATPAAQCKLTSSQVVAPMLDDKPGGAAGEHGDLDADLHFVCARPGALAGMEVRLGDRFPRLHRIVTQVVTDKGQFARTLDADQRQLSW